MIKTPKTSFYWPPLPPPPPPPHSSRLADVSGWLLPSWEQPADDSDLHRCLQRLSVLPAKPSQPAGLAESPSGQQSGSQRRGVGPHLLQIQLRWNPVDVSQDKRGWERSLVFIPSQSRGNKTSYYTFLSTWIRPLFLKLNKICRSIVLNPILLNISAGDMMKMMK